MKKLTKIITLVLALMLALTTLVACNPESDSEGTVTLVIDNGETQDIFTVEIADVEGDEGVLSIIKHLKAEGKLDYKIDSSDFLHEIGSVKENPAEGKYVGVWTSAKEDFDVSGYATTKQFRDLTLTSSGFGVKDMTVKDGAFIYFSYIIWG